MPDGGGSLPFPATHSAGGKAVGRPVRAPDRGRRRYPREPYLQKVGSLCNPDVGTEGAVRRAAGEVTSETGTRNLRERLSRADKTGAQTRLASDFEADSRA